MGIVTLFVFFCGICIGSFLNVCIYRMPVPGKSIVSPGSYCPRCKKHIVWYDNIPLLSYLLLRGRCRMCRAPIPFRYFFIELLTGVCFVFLMHFYSTFSCAWVRFLHAALLASILIAVTFIDIDHFIIPDQINFFGIAAGLSLSFFFPCLMGVQGHMHALLLSFCAGTAGAGILWSIAILGTWLFKKEAMGMGDVKFIALAGVFLGFKACLVTIMTASVIGSLIGIGLILFKSKKLDARIPFGPYLAMGSFIALLFSDRIIAWYISFVMGI